nr:MAG TPA: hypothetical protein [Caudoviricetes sp.]
MLHGKNSETAFSTLDMNNITLYNTKHEQGMVHHLPMVC